MTIKPFGKGFIMNGQVKRIRTKDLKLVIEGYQQLHEMPLQQTNSASGFKPGESSLMGLNGSIPYKVNGQTLILSHYDGLHVGPTVINSIPKHLSKTERLLLSEHLPRDQA